MCKYTVCQLTGTFCVHCFPFQLYNARVKSAAEERLWKEIDWEFMSEESHSDGDDTIRKHPVTFRSEGKNDRFAICVLWLQVPLFSFR